MEEQLKKGLRHTVEKMCIIFCCDLRRSEAYSNEDSRDRDGANKVDDGNKDNVWNQPTTQIFSDKEIIYVLYIS